MSARTSATAPVLVGLLLVVSALGVARMQPRLAKAAHEVKLRDDIYVLPPPNETHALALGYDSAAVDLLWAKLVVEYGVHMSEHRDFHPDPYLDSILAIEPTFPLVYKFADTLLCYRPLRGTEADARKAREILIRGTRERPGDYEVWTEYGEYVAFLGPSFLPTESEKDAWRLEGALALTKAVTLGGDATRSLAAATLLSDAGESKAQIKALRGALSMTDDPAMRSQIQAKLDALGASAEIEADRKAYDFMTTRWRDHYTFMKRDTFLLIAPLRDAARCAGPASEDESACPRNWDEALAAAP